MKRSRKKNKNWRILIWPGFFALGALILLCALGFWQLQRLAWKQDLIARVEERAQTSFTPPAPAESDWPNVTVERDEYRRIRVKGTFKHDREALAYDLLSDAKGKFSGPGYWVLTPLETADGTIVFVNRGFVPLDRKDAATRQEGQVLGPVTITGLMRMPEGRAWFTPADDPVHGVWQERNPAIISKAYGLARTAPFFIDADAKPNPGGLPQGGETRLVFSNRHLEYAVTWFGLAFALIAVFIAFVRKQLRPRKRA
jgi:surfeit locus 1 family protein